MSIRKKKAYSKLQITDYAISFHASYKILVFFFYIFTLYITYDVLYNKSSIYITFLKIFSDPLLFLHKKYIYRKNHPKETSLWLFCRMSMKLRQKLHCIDWRALHKIILWGWLEYTRIHTKNTTRGWEEGYEGKSIRGTVAPFFWSKGFDQAEPKLTARAALSPVLGSLRHSVMCSEVKCKQQKILVRVGHSLPIQSLLSLWGMISVLHLQRNSSLDSHHKDTHAWVWLTPLLTYFSYLLWLCSRAVRQTICSVSRQLLLLLL